MRTGLSAVGKIVAVVVALDVAVFYLRLGWFLPLVWVLGGVIVVVVTRWEWKLIGRRGIVVGAFVALYVLFTWGGLAATVWSRVRRSI